MKFRYPTLLGFCILLAALAPATWHQKAQSELSVDQRLSVMTSKLETMRRSLNSAIGALPSDNKDKKCRRSS